MKGVGLNNWVKLNEKGKKHLSLSYVRKRQCPIVKLTLL